MFAYADVCFYTNLVCTKFELQYVWKIPNFYLIPTMINYKSKLSVSNGQKRCPHTRFVLKYYSLE